MAKIFGEFFQVDGSYARRNYGTGLGLSLVKKFVELQGGVVGVTSTLGRGTSFEFTLPVDVAPHACSELGLKAPAEESEPFGVRSESIDSEARSLESSPAADESVAREVGT